MRLPPGLRVVQVVDEPARLDRLTVPGAAGDPSLRHWAANGSSTVMADVASSAAAIAAPAAGGA